MITLIREDHTDTSGETETTSYNKIRQHLDLVENVEEILKLRDYFISDPKYETDPNKRLLRLNKQFPIFSTDGSSNEVSFFKQVEAKKDLDEKLDTNPSNYQLATMFDESNLINTQYGLQTHLHFNLKEHYNLEELALAIRTLAVIVKGQGNNTLIFCILNKVTDYQGLKVTDYEKSIGDLNKRLKGETGLKNLFIRTLATYNEVTNYKDFFFPVSHNVYLINKIMTARQTLVEMVRVRGYKGTPNYIYFDNFSGRFGHFKMDLESRLEKMMTLQLPLQLRNYFDILVTPSVPGSSSVYVHFLLASVPDFQTYISEMEDSFRMQFGIDRNAPFRLILVVNKKQTAKNIIEKIGDRPDPTRKFIVDIMLLEGLLHNPLDNVNQPKFTLIKKRSDRERYKEILDHYGSADDIPRITSKDPVNKFFGGEHNDIYEIIRPNVTKITVNDDLVDELHLDIAYRIVRGA